MIIDAKELRIGELKGKSRVLCIDYGDKRVGVAISDKNWIIASPLVVLETHKIYQKLLPIIDEYEIGLIIIGAPLALNGGTSGKQLEKVTKFAQKLDEHVQRSIVLWDERLSTHGASRILEEAEISKYHQKNHIDKIAASFILEGFLDYCKRCIGK